MAKRRRPQGDVDDGGGLDSLLDTMTNVVGILVMVLIATQLGVKDAVHRISESEVVDPAAIEKAREQLLLTQTQRDAIEAQLNDLKPVDDNAIQVQLTDLRRQRNETRSQIDQENQAANQFAQKLAQDTKRAEAAKKTIQEMADAKANREKLQGELTKALESEATMKALLDETPAQEAPPPKIVKLPDPRPAPEGIRQLTFLCANNKVYPIAADEWRETIRKKAEYIVASKRLDGGPQVGVDQERFMQEFKRANRTLRGKFFEIEIFAAGIYPRLRFTPLEKAGSTLREVVKARSRFQRILSGIDKDKYFARFIVLPDSYEVYLAARAVATEMGILAGWDPLPANWQFTTHLGGKILFGPKPKPQPNAKPPPKPTKPPNAID